MDGEGSVGANSAIAVDSNEIVHISYIDSTNEKLKYMTNASGEWITWTIGSASDRATSIAVDANGKCHIVYENNGDLKSEWIPTIESILAFMTMLYPTV